MKAFKSVGELNSTERNEYEHALQEVKANGPMAHYCYSFDVVRGTIEATVKRMKPSARKVVLERMNRQGWDTPIQQFYYDMLNAYVDASEDVQEHQALAFQAARVFAGNAKQPCDLIDKETKKGF